MANTFKIAKQLQRKFPRKYSDWQKAVKAAGRKIKKGNARKVASPKKVKRVSSTGKRRKKRTVSGSTNSRYHTDYNRNKVDISVGSVKKHLSIARHALEKQLGVQEVKRFNASTKTVKKKIGKKISALKSKINKLKFNY